MEEKDLCQPKGKPYAEKKGWNGSSVMVYVAPVKVANEAKVSLSLETPVTNSSPFCKSSIQISFIQFSSMQF